MLRGPLHNRGANGSCEACGEPFPCPDGIAIFESVKREYERPAPSPVVERCPWCGLTLNGIEPVASHGHRICRRCAGCIASNPHTYGTDSYIAWAVQHGDV